MTSPALAPAHFGPRNAQPLDQIIPGALDVLQGLFAPPDPKDMPPLARAAMEAQAEIKRIASEKFSDDAGRMLLEAICDATIRRPVMVVVRGLTIEQAALYAAKREGQNDTVYMLLAMIAGGRGEQPPAREGA